MSFLSLLFLVEKKGSALLNVPHNEDLVSIYMLKKTVFLQYSKVSFNHGHTCINEVENGTKHSRFFE